MSNSRRWKEWITWWRELDVTEYGDQYALIKAINKKIDEIWLRNSPPLSNPYPYPMPPSKDKIAVWKDITIEGMNDKIDEILIRNIPP